MAKPIRTIKNSAGTPSVSRAKLDAAARVVVAKSASTGRFVATKSVAKTATRTAQKTLSAQVSAAVHAPSVIRSASVKSAAKRKASKRAG